MERGFGVRCVGSDQNHAGPIGFDKGFCICLRSNGTPLKGSGVIRSPFRKDCWLSMEACSECGQSSQGAINGVSWGNAGHLDWGDDSQAERSECICCLCICLE